MFTSILIITLLFPVAFLTSNLENFFSADEMSEMGIQLENPNI